MFWGITLDAGKRYTQTVEKSFHLSMAALGFHNGTGDPVTIMVEVDRAQFALCTLQAGKIPQQSLDYAFTEGEEITFYTEGQSEVHLTGYLVEEPETIEFDDADEMSVESDESESASESDEESGSKSDGSEEEESSSEEAITLQDLLQADNGIPDDDEESDDDDGEWDPSKDNPKPQKKGKAKKGVKRKRNAGKSAEEPADMEENGVSNGKTNQKSAEAEEKTLNDMPLLPSDDEDSDEYVPGKVPKKTKKKLSRKDKKMLFKRKGRS